MIRSIDLTDEKDHHAILSLMERVYPGSEWSEEYLDWQYRKSPAGPANVRVIEVNDHAVAMDAAVLKPLTIDGERRYIWMVQDVMTEPSFRGQGLRHELAHHFADILAATGEFGIAFPNKPAENSLRRCGWTELARVPLYTAAPQMGTNLLVVTPVEQFDDLATFVWTNSDAHIGVTRDAAYLNWRYSRPRTFYRKFMVDDAAVLVLKAFVENGLTTIHICELFTRADSRWIITRLLDFVRAYAVIRGAGKVTAWSFDNIYNVAGFERDKTNDRFIFVRGPTDSLPLWNYPGNWFLTQGDSDVY